MSDQRKHIYAILNGRYKKYQFATNHICFYCGEPADTQDHVPALYQAYCWGLDYIEANEIDLVLVPSCRECNGLLGARPHSDPEDRKECLKGLLKKRYAKFLKLPDWDEDELDELGPVMRREVVDSLNLKLHITRRLAW